MRTTIVPAGIDYRWSLRRGPWVYAVGLAAMRRITVVSMLLGIVCLPPGQSRVAQAAQPARTECGAATAIGVVRAYYFEIARHAPAGAKSCLTAAYLKTVSRAVDPDWKNIVTVRIMSLKAYRANARYVPELRPPPFRVVQIFVQLQVRYYMLYSSSNGVNDRFIYVIREHPTSPWRIAGIGSGP